MLDLLHVSEAALVRRTGARHGGGRVLAGRTGDQADTRIIEAKIGADADQLAHLSRGRSD